MRENGQKNASHIHQMHQALLKASLDYVNDQVHCTSQAQAVFLEVRRSGLAQMSQLIKREISGSGGLNASSRKPLLEAWQLDAFGRGSLVDCLGPAYAVYEGRRAPRIPNGDLKLVSRVMELRGEPGEFKNPASIETEYDVPSDAWFFTGSIYTATPYSILMEMALQPCGILSAWMGTMLQAPEMDFYFRNLDGWSEVLSDQDLRGKTVTAQANLLSSLSTGDTIIQKFQFTLSCAGVALYRGESSFGYFSSQAMAKQLGLDNGSQTQSHAGAAAVPLTDIRQYLQPNPAQPALHLPGGRLQLLKQAGVSMSGGRYGKGYVYARKEINPQDWFYDCHFYQDPVMPGSLGIEAVTQALAIYAIEKGLGGRMRSPRFGAPVGKRLNWKYRGQITPAHKKMELEAHVSSIEQTDNQIAVLADASLWVDNIRIYEMKQASISLVEG